MLFFDYYPEKGSCAGGPGGHNKAYYTYNYALPHDIPASSTQQSQWSYCGNCRALFYDQYPEKGSCPAGGGHKKASNTYNYVLSFVPPGPFDAMSAQELELLGLINDARAHPEKYQPHGNASGAAMNACPILFQYSVDLRNIARQHNSDLAAQPIEWVAAGDNVHRAGPGKPLTWDDGEPMHKAGYLNRAENVATGHSTPADVMRFWMQDDEAYDWGHRNNILNCTLLDAGIGYHQGGPYGHYWTLDMGTR